MVEIRREVSPDGLVFLVERDGADIVMGLEGSDWHTHPDLFERFDGNAERTAMAVVDDLIAGRVLLVRRAEPDGSYWELLGDIALELSPVAPVEALSIRSWAGAAIDPDDLVTGRLTYTPIR